ncbi:MAG: glutaredoxin 3 [Proteobacteria bacterium]|nr:glutaredoxin 3 [Pseudomonadota bacterium]
MDSLILKNQITIFTTTYCPYCTFAKDFLTRNALPFVEIDVTGNTSFREDLVKKTGGRTTVPQIFIGETSIGGYDDLMALSKTNNFEKLLKNAGIMLKNPLD